MGEHNERLNAQAQPPSWVGDSIYDPDGCTKYLAVDAYDKAGAQIEAGPEYRLVGREWFKLRALNEHDEDDAYLIGEWGCTAAAEPAEPSEPGAREFWAFIHPSLEPYMEASDA